MSFKSFNQSTDIASIVSAVNEVVSISKSLYMSDYNNIVRVYGNVAATVAGTSGSYWNTVYDSAYASVQSSPLFDVTFGMTTSSIHYGSTVKCKLEKAKVYREMASLLLGNADLKFPLPMPASGNISIDNAFFILFKRGIMKDEIKKGSVTVNYVSASNLAINDATAVNSFNQSVGGDWAYIMSGSTKAGIVYYNAGVIVLPGTGFNTNSGSVWNNSSPWGTSPTLDSAIRSGSIDDAIYGLLTGPISKISINNQTNLYSTVYFCRALNSDFNYSSNPTYIDSSQRIRVTSGSNIMQPRTYITKVGLYDANDNLLAVGSLNKPITKSPDTEAIFRIRLDY